MLTRAASAELVEAMLGRARQFGLRLGIGLAIAIMLGPSLGWGSTGLWYLVWSALQLTERSWTERAAEAQGRGEAVLAAPGLLLIFAANLVFAGLGVVAVFSGDVWLMVCGMWLLAGGLLNAAASSAASTPVFLVGAAPAAVGSLSVLVVAGRAQASPGQMAALAIGSSLLLFATYTLRQMGFLALIAAKEASAFKDEFLANVSHEIRTPLNGVLGMAQVMAAGELPPEQRERLEVINRSGRSLLALLNDVLDLSKIEAGMLEIEMGEVDLEQLALDLVRSFDAASADKPVAVSASIDPAVAGVWRGDPVRIRQILSNLLSNAVKFTAEGEVRLQAAATDGGVEVAVSDEGMGIPADRLETVFEKYVQASSGAQRQYGGTGLGLAICRELATRMGGRLSAESTVGVGSTFRLWLPLERCAARPDRVGAASDEALDLTRLKVLAAEDHPTNQAVLRLMLEPLGVEVEIVGDGQAAVEAWRAGDWDLILMDVQMPVLDGPGAVRTIREEETRDGRARTPILALTANAMTHQIEQYLAGGMDGYVAKPLELGRLVEAIADAARPSAPPEALATARRRPAARARRRG